MSSHTTALLAEIRADFEQLVALVTGPLAASATLDQMARSLFRRVFAFGAAVVGVVPGNACDDREPSAAPV